MEKQDDRLRREKVRMGDCFRGRMESYEGEALRREGIKTKERSEKEEKDDKRRLVEGRSWLEEVMTPNHKASATSSLDLVLHPFIPPSSSHSHPSSSERCIS